MSETKQVSVLRPGIAQTHRTEAIPDHRYPSTRTKASYGLDVQIRELKAHIERKLRQVVQLVRNGRYDQAGKVCDIISEARARLVLMAVGIEALEPEPEAEPIMVKPKVKAVKKPRTYKRWSEK
jgi:hypothetical protein